MKNATVHTFTITIEGKDQDILRIKDQDGNYIYAYIKRKGTFQSTGRTSISYRICGATFNGATYSFNNSRQWKRDRKGAVSQAFWNFYQQAKAVLDDNDRDTVYIMTW